ncbi:glycerate kinase [Eubacterium sp. MSJ-21]|nr:glycerate kinase [Eubacterium sp. MSJ-21]
MDNNFNKRKRQKKIVVAMDSFKGSLTSLEAGNAVRDGILERYPDFDVQIFPVADGGEGTVEALTFGKEHVQTRTISVTGPIGTEVSAGYTIYEQAGEKTAVLEMAQAAGLPLVPEERRNPMHTTTYGVGEMIRDAITCGCRKFILGIGGSATNDAGIGMLQALGFHFMDEAGREVGYGAEGLAQVRAITTEDVMPELASCTFQIACDVTNPLVGAQGCSAVFAPQKGADAKMVQEMDAAMNRYADVVEDMYRKNPTPMENQLTGYDEAGKNVDKNDRQSHDKKRMTPGVGAAGGLGYACLMFLHATLKPGIDIVLDEIQIAQAIKNADAVITGEGRFDAQTLMGKTPIGVARIAKLYSVPVYAFAGCFGADVQVCIDSGVFAGCYVASAACTEEEKQLAMEKTRAYANLRNCVRNNLTGL